MSADVFVKIFTLFVFSMLFVFFFVGIFRKKFFLSFGTLGLSADFNKHRRTRKKAAFMNVLLAIGVIFAFLGFTSEVKIIYTAGQIFTTLTISFILYFLLERIGLQR